VAGFDDEFVDRPASVIHEETANVTDRFIAGLDVVAGYGLGALEVLVVRLVLEVSFQLVF